MSHRGNRGNKAGPANLNRFNEVLNDVAQFKPVSGYENVDYSNAYYNVDLPTDAPTAPDSISTLTTQMEKIEMTPAGDAKLQAAANRVLNINQPQRTYNDNEFANSKADVNDANANGDNANDDYDNANHDSELPNADKQGNFGTQSRGSRTREPREPRPPRDGRQRYIPATRDVAEIRKEDEKAADLYKDIFDNDEDIIVTGVDKPQVLDNWNEARIHESVMKNIALANYVKPRKIQSYAIPLIFDGHDVKGQAETGSGKSAAFLVPIISHIARERAEKTDSHKVNNRPLCMIIEPTRELALQLYDQGRKLADSTNVQIVKAYGEYDYKANAQEVIRACDIVVGTPGRLYAFLQDGIIRPNDIKWLVLDEADRLLDKNFHRDIINITSGYTFPAKEDRQTLLFSATFPEEVNALIDVVLKPKHVSVTNKRPSAPNAKVEQSFQQVPQAGKKELVVNVLKDALEAARSDNPNAKQQRTLIFVETKRDADVVALYLCQYELPATTINGDRTQDLREEALAEFRDGTKPILVATDVCARGLDIKDLDIVVNMDMPRDIETYIHRIGRTGRLVKGRAISFFDENNPQDQRLAPELVKVLTETGSAEVPDYINEAAEAAAAAVPASGANAADLAPIDFNDLDDMDI